MDVLKYVVLVENHHYFLPICIIFDRLLKGDPPTTGHYEEVKNNISSSHQ